jgi:nitrate/nitrite transporter NarK
MSLLPKINKKRLGAFREGQPENNFVRASEHNDVVEKLNGFNALSIVTESGTNAPTVNGTIGEFTTSSLTTAAATGATFTVTNSEVKATSRVMAFVTGYSGTIGTNGIPLIFRTVCSDGSVAITIVNAGANALAGTVKIAFIVY